MSRLLRTCTASVVLIVFFCTPVKAELDTQVDIPFDLFRLDNGLTVLVHTDHSTPTVFVGMWYGVGSKDEPEGKTGFAHLFEHLMFQGTDNRDGEYFSPFMDAGATGMNGTTAEDRTNYYATVPTGALDMALWMESDRMSHLLGAVTQDALDEQRGVVQNEKRQYETRPYAQMDDKIRAGLYPLDHPYRHSIIGSMEDLDAASLDDVHEWFNTYYGASNVILVLAGDIDVGTAKEKVSYYFGEAPVGEALSYAKEWIPDLRENRREAMYDRVGQTRISRVWALPSLNDKDTSLMYLVNETLAGNKNSPIWKTLVDDLQLATNVRGLAYGRVMSGEYNLTIDLKPGVMPEQVLQIVDDLIAGYVEDGPDRQILENSKLAINMYMIGALETGSSIGRLLAEGYLYSDDPLFINKELEWLNAATTGELRAVAERWLGRGYYELTVFPFPDYTSAESAVDRSTIPEVTADSTIRFPAIQATRLDNGVNLVVATRGSIPIVDVNVVVDTGSIAAPSDAPGLADFMFALLDKGTKNYDANELATEKDQIAMSGGFRSGLERSALGYRILRDNLDRSLELSVDMLRNPAFPDDELQKLKTQIGASLATLEKNPSGAASSLFERAVYGDENPMGAMWRPEYLEQVDRDRLLAFHYVEVAPNNITIYMIGDISIDEARESVERAFGRWKSKSNSARRAIGKALPGIARVILIDYPGAASSTIYAGHAVAPFDAETNTEQSVMNAVLGGGFESRLNMNLREDKAWSYGYRSGIQVNSSGDQYFTTRGQVQTDKTAASMREIMREIKEYITTNPATDTEVDRIKINRIRSLPGTFATNRGFLASIVASDQFGLPYDYAEARSERIDALTTDGINARARTMLDPNKLTWVVVGDLSVVESDVRALNFGEIEVWDAFGNRQR